jgi:hypothetical protein
MTKYLKNSSYPELIMMHISAFIIAYEMSFLPSDQVIIKRIFFDEFDIPSTFKKDAQIILYGSLLFNCCLKDRSNIDIDIQFNDILPYETLKEVLEIVRNSSMKHFLSNKIILCCS